MYWLVLQSILSVFIESAVLRTFIRGLLTYINIFIIFIIAVVAMITFIADLNFYVNSRSKSYRWKNLKTRSFNNHLQLEKE